MDAASVIVSEKEKMSLLLIIINSIKAILGNFVKDVLRENAL